MPRPVGALLSFGASGLIGGHRRGWVPPVVAEVTSHLDLTDRDQEDHPKYGPLSAANSWSNLNTFASKVSVSSLGLNQAFAPSGFWFNVAELNPPPGRVGVGVSLGFTGFSPGFNQVGVAGYSLSKDAAIPSAYGLDFVAGLWDVSLASAFGARVTGLAIGLGRTLTAFYGFYVNAPGVIQATIATAYGVYIASQNPAIARRPLYDTNPPASGHHSVLASTLQLFSTTPSFGSGVGVLGIANATTVPSTNPAAGGVMYASGGALYWRGSAGTVTPVAPA